MFKPEFDINPGRETVSHQHPELRLELESTLREINTSLEYVKTLAEQRGVPPETMQYPNGTYIQFGLLAAKAQVLSALTRFA